MHYNDSKLAIIGLGYVGLPLAVAFGTKRSTVGYDLNNTRIDQLKNHEDLTLETTPEDLKNAIHLTYTNNLEDIKNCNIFIITVPTPIDKNNDPDLTPIKKASEAIGSILKTGDIVIYESTVFPGAT